MAAEKEQDLRAALVAELNEGNATAVLETYRKGRVLETIDADPKLRKPLRSMVAEKFPGTREMMPETAVEAAVAPAIAAIDQRLKKMDERDAADAQHKANASWRADLMKHGIPAKDLDAVEKLATERMNMDPESLALLWKNMHTPARASAGFGRPLIPGANEDAFFKGILDDPDGWVLNRGSALWNIVEAGRDPDSVDWTKEAIA